ncbi:MAG: M23 family metallopeptidase [Candidatus Thorarchaeota archaeon]
MRRRTSCIILLVIICIGVVLYIQFGGVPINPDPPNGENTFDNEGRYDSANLNYMGIIYTNQSDILNWNGGYSESTNCPWGATHNGLDFAFVNDSEVIAAAPGLVEEIHWTDTGPTENIYMIHVSIRFNESIQIGYVFEPWTTNSTDADRQIEMLEIEVGDWVAKGDTIGHFLAIGGGAHIHFAVYDGEATCPRPFFSEDAYLELMSLVHSYHSDWELCYP